MVFTPLKTNKLKEIFDDTAIKTIEFFIKKSLFSQPERVEEQDALPIQVPKEHIEQWVVQAIGAKPVGAGSYPVDVIKEDDFGADVKMLSCKVTNGKLANSDSGETSISQKFTDAGTNLDQLFSNKEYETILSDWNSILENKLNKVYNEKSVDKIYYFFILRAQSTFYFCGLDVNVDEIRSTTVNRTRTTNKSVYADGFIDDKYGSVKVYKSKKRMELRLRPKQWLSDKLLLEFPLDFETKVVDIREKIESNSINKYIDDLQKELFERGN